MGFLDALERGIERFVNTFIAKVFKSRVEPIELASALRKEADDKAAVLGQGYVLVPNVYSLELSTSDFERAKVLGEPLAAELAAELHEHVKAQKYSLSGPIKVSFGPNEKLSTGVYHVVSSTATDVQPHSAFAAGTASPQESIPASRPTAPAASQGFSSARAAASSRQTSAPQAPSPQATAAAVPAEPKRRPVKPRALQSRLQSKMLDTSHTRRIEQAATTSFTLVVNGKSHKLFTGTVTIGRSNECDIQIDDSSASRRHFTIQIGQHDAVLEDLQSTNGTFVDGQQVERARLRDGSLITVGRTRMVFGAKNHVEQR